MSKLKLVVVGSEKCVPCKVMNNQILDRIDELEILNCEYEYVSLDGLEDKDTFIEKYKLSCTPTSWIEQEGFMTEKNNGYIDIDSLFEQVKQLGGE